MPYTFVTLAGVAAGAALLLTLGLHFWFRERGKKAAALTLVPVVFAWLHGMLAVMATAGSWSALSAVAWAGLWVTQAAGYLGLVWGVGGSNPDVTRTLGMVLTDGGYVMLLLATITLVALWMWGKVPRWKLLCAWLSGTTLGLAGGVAGVVAVPLASAVNMGGALFTGALL